MPVDPNQTDRTLSGDHAVVPAALGPAERALMAERLRQVDELSQFLVAMRDAVRSKLRDA